MEYRRLGNSNLVVSRLWLGGMSLGSPEQRPWVADASTSARIIARALEAGINTIDTADAYALGESETVIGRTLGAMGIRDEIVIATKFGLPLGSKDPNRNGYSRRNIVDRCEAALKRLGTDRIDILQTHIWRDGTEVEEVAAAFDQLVRQGKVLYVGITDMPAWQAAKWIYHSRYTGLAPITSLQHHFNPIWRGDERDLIPLCDAEGVGIVAYSPIARGFLAGAGRSTLREATDDMTRRFYGREADAAAQGRLTTLSASLGLSAAQLALSWVLGRRHVCAAVVGPTSVDQLSELVTCADGSAGLGAEVAQAIDDMYAPRLEAGHG